MPICSFFLQNRCRFGENCRFEHPRGGGQGGGGGAGGAQRNLFGGNGGQRVTFRDSFGTAGNQGVNAGNNQFKWNSGQQTQGGQSTSAMDMVNSLPKEMDAWEQTKMWPFSCVSVEKELPCLPEFHDISVEEIRVEAYEAQKMGSMQAFTIKLQGIAQQYQTKRNQLKNMSMDVKQKLFTFIEDARKKKAQQAYSLTGSSPSILGLPASSQSGQGLFGNTPSTTTGNSSGLFGQPGSGVGVGGGSAFGNTCGAGLFGKPAAQSSPFGSASTAFGNTNTPSTVFGTPQRPHNSPGVGVGSGGLFGSPAQAGVNSMFGQNSSTPSQPGTGLFGQQPQSTPTQGMFGNSAASIPTGLFGKPANIAVGVGGQQQNSVFGSLGNSNNSSTTAAGSATGLFGKPANGGSIFGQQSPSTVPSGLFGGGGQNPNPAAAAGGGIFGTMNNNNNQSSTTPMAGGGSGLFGKPATVPSGLFGQMGQQQPSAAATVVGGSIFSPAAMVSGGGGGAGLLGKGPQVPGSQPPTQGSSGSFGNSGGVGNSPLAHGSVGGGSVFGGGPGVVPSTTVNNSGNNSKQFSAMDDLTPQDIEAFKASQFVLGNIPIKPPPRELVVL